MLSPAVTDSPFLDLDWFNPNTQDYWSNEFVNYFNPETGIDIDGAWIDMNEPSSVSIYMFLSVLFLILERSFVTILAQIPLDLPNSKECLLIGQLPLQILMHRFLEKVLLLILRIYNQDISRRHIQIKDRLLSMLMQRW